MNNINLVFNQLSNNFSHLRPICGSNNDDDKLLIRNVLHELNALDYRYLIVQNHTRAVLLINQLCTLIPPEEVDLVVESCQLINKLITMQKVQVEGRTLPIAVDWLLNALQATQAHEEDAHHRMLHIVIALEAFLRCSTPKSELIHKITHTHGVIMETFRTSGNLSVKVVIGQCLEAITLVAVEEPCANLHGNYEVIVAGVIEQMKSTMGMQPQQIAEVDVCKLLTVAIRTLRNVTVRCGHVLAGQLEQFMGVCKSLMVYKLRGIELLPMGRTLPSMLSIPECTGGDAVAGGRQPLQRQRRQRPVGKKLPAKEDAKETQRDEGGTETSESDVESGDKLCVFRAESKVRQETLLFLLAITKCVDKTTLFAYLTVFLPDASSLHGHYVTNCVLKDPSPRGRMAALNVLLNMLVTGKPLLSHAEEDKRQSASAVSSFTPLSTVLAGMVRELHRTLCLALNETSFPVLTQVLKCLAALVQATPYHRLRAGLTAKVTRNVKLLVAHKDSTVQVAALIVLGCLLASTPPIKETTCAFTRNVVVPVHANNADQAAIGDKKELHELDYANFSDDDDAAEHSDAEATTATTVPWLIDKCMRNLLVAAGGDNNVPAPVKLESLQIVAGMCSDHHFEVLVLPHLVNVTKALEFALVDKYVDVRFHAGKTTEHLGEAMHKHYQLAGCLDSSLTFWQTLLNADHGPLLSASMLQSDQGFLRAVGCDCLGSIGDRTFELLPKHRQLVCMTTLLSLTQDDDNGVKGSAVRAIAMLLLYPSVRADSGFVMDAADTIVRTMADANIGVRIKASWSLGNLSDALVLNRKQTADEDEAALPEGYLIALIKAAVAGSADNEKVKSNAVRALGNLLQLLNASHSRIDIMDEGVEALLKCTNSGSIMKVRWNACYALGNVLKMAPLYENASGRPKVILKSLAELVVGFKNLKVRINAALALSACQQRECYADSYFMVWEALIKGLENAENVTDFNEYKHRDNLVEQICLTLGHMTSLLLVPNDLLPLGEMLAGRESMLQTQMRRVYDRLLPEKSTILVAGRTHLNDAGHTGAALTHQQSHVLNTLRQIFDNEVSF